MKKHLYTGIFVLLISVLANAQPSIIFNYAPPKEALASNIETYYVEDIKSKTLTVSIRNKNSIKRFLLFADGKIQKEFFQTVSGYISADEAFHKKSVISQEAFSIYETTKYIGGTRTNNLMIETFWSEKNNKYFFLETNIENGSTNSSSALECRQKEKLLASFAEENEIWFITYFNRVDSLFFYRKVFGKDVEKKVLGINLGDTFKGVSRLAPGIASSFSSFLKEKGSATLQSNRDYPLIVNSTSKKIIQSKNSITFLVTSLNYKTYTVTVKLPEFTYVSIYDQNPKEINPYQHSLVSRSCIVDNKIISFHVVAENKLLLNFFDIETNKIISTQLFSTDDVNRIGTKPVTKIGTFSSIDELKVANISTMLNRVEQIGISASLDNGIIYVTIGGMYNRLSFEEVALSIAGSAVGTYAMNAIPTNSSWLVITGIDILDPKNTVSLQLAFDQNNLQLLKTNPRINPFEQIGRFLKNNRKTFSKEQLIYFNEKFYFGALTERATKYVIYRFDKK